MQTTNPGNDRRRVLCFLVDRPLPLDLLPADAVRFIPVQLRFAYSACSQPDDGDSLQFPPTTPFVQTPKPSGVAADPAARRDRLVCVISPTISKGTGDHYDLASIGTPAASAEIDVETIFAMLRDVPHNAHVDRPRQATRAPVRCSELLGLGSLARPACSEPTRFVRVIDDLDRPWNAGLSLDESSPFQHLNHLVRGRSRHEEVTCYIRFGWRDPISEEVRGDELEVVPLTPRGLGTVGTAARRTRGRTALQGCRNVAITHAHCKDGIVGEVNVIRSASGWLTWDTVFPVTSFVMSAVSMPDLSIAATSYALTPWPEAQRAGSAARPRRGPSAATGG
jgi:hypothetical protein